MTQGQQRPDLAPPAPATFLEQLACEAAITHASIDTLPNSRTREYVRALLVEHGDVPGIPSAA